MITQERLKQVINYDPDTGIFRWIKDGVVNLNSVAGCVDEWGYIRIRVDGVLYRAHRLAFLYMRGSFPELSVDHVNLIKSDNRWGNIRQATSSQNMANCAKYKTNSSGTKGIRITKHNTYNAYIHFKGRQKSKTFKTKEEADLWLLVTRRKIQKEFARS